MIKIKGLIKLGWCLLGATLAVKSQGLAIQPMLNEQVMRFIQSNYGVHASRRASAWRNLLAEHREGSELHKLTQVNRFFNQVPFVSDPKHWQREDYWATPLEFIGTNGGDCEDFVIAKYFTLKALGVPINRMRITYVTALRLNQAHMVLTYYETPGAEPLVLDNLINRILPASKRQDLAPLYSFNGDGIWLAGKSRAQVRMGDPNKLNSWNDLRFRMLQQGLKL